MARRPDLEDIYRLAGQLERDREQPMDALRRRDHEVAAECPEGADEVLLLHWLDRVAVDEGGGRFGSSAAVYLSRLLALVFGFAAMGGFLLGSSRGLVNVLLLLSIFVLLQLLMSLLSAVTLLRTVSGHVPAALPANPASWIARRSFPDGRYLRESAAVLRLLFLRHGQVLAALFTLGALAAFVLVPALTEFSFVWGSTFPIGNEFMQRLTAALAAPWSALLSGATVAPEVVASSRYHPALVNLDRAGIESMRGWWAFLFMCLLLYALLPRLLLWLGARVAYPRVLRRSFLEYPGADLVLGRMRRPLVSTQASKGENDEAAESRSGTPVAALPVDGRLLVLNWSDALAGESPGSFEELLSVAADNVMVAGTGALEEERQQLRARGKGDFDHLLVVVKSWEPPMAELADLLEELAAIPRCTLYLLPLPGKAVPHRKVEDWRLFARGLPFASVDVRLLNRVAAA
jgi:hypothetical protein